MLFHTSNPDTIFPGLICLAFTTTLKLLFCEAFVNDKLIGSTVISTPFGALTVALYTEAGGPTLVTLRLNTAMVDALAVLSVSCMVG